MRKYIFLLIGLCFTILAARDSTRQDTAKSIPPASIQQKPAATAAQPDWIRIGTLVVAVAGFVFVIYQHFSKKKLESEIARLKAKAEIDLKTKAEVDKIQHVAKSAEQMLRDALTQELGSIRLLGSDQIRNVSVLLLQSFVNLRISESYRSEERALAGHLRECEGAESDLSPAAICRRAFSRYRMVLIIGDPGSGKTTLLKYFAMTILGGQAGELGLEPEILPLYLPLRELNPGDSLSQNLASWADRHEQQIPETVFYDWLHHRKTLLLLDGLDEISNMDQRRKICQWIDERATGLKNARWVVTSRWTGYNKLDGIQLEFDHLRADIKDFTREQQQEFLKKWFHAAFCAELPPPQGDPNWLSHQEQKAQKQAQEMIQYLEKPENEAVRSLAASPMLLQIIAILGKERAFHARNRAELYSAALNYLLDLRDRKRNLPPPLSASDARTVLAPTALWLQEKIKRDDVPRKKMHDYLQPLIQPYNEKLTAADFCKNLCERAGILVETGQADYLFRHKSFREYLCGLQLKEKANDRAFLRRLVAHFNDDWWEEPLRFFMGEATADKFDQFMDCLFGAEVSRELDQKAQNRLQQLIKDAPAKKIDALARRLKDHRLNANQQRYLLESLKTIGTTDALAQIKAFAKSTGTETGRLALEFTLRIEPEPATAQASTLNVFPALPPAFFNSREENAEYILIPGGTYRFSVTGKDVTVSPTYFARYPVTNQRYRRFIAYLQGNDPLTERLPLATFVPELTRLAEKLAKFSDYLPKNPADWALKFQSKMDDKKFLGDDQPVVRVTWYDAQAYCCWLTALEAAAGAPAKPVYFRLPHEKEWEWAAAGREPDGVLREYPWPKRQGEPTPKLANYGQNVGMTTPVGRYPDGATPEGLQDMAGNVWEWQANWYKGEGAALCLRGGSWGDYGVNLRCSARGDYHPAYAWSFAGFRVVLAESRVFENLVL